MSTRHYAAGMFLGSLTILWPCLVSSQDYPNKPVRIITQSAGSTNDTLARFIASELSKSLGSPVIMDNRGSATLAAETASKAPPDGYSLLSAGSTVWILPLLQKTPYDPVKDFAPVAFIARSVNVLVVHPTLPVNSVKELIALAKAKPGVLNYSSSGVGGSSHLAMELFKATAGVNIVHVPYKVNTAALTDLRTGQVQMTIDNPNTVMPFVKSKKVRALAVTSLEPSILVPGLPTVAASLPGFESVIVFGIFAPAKTPEAIVRRLNQEIVRILGQADLKERFFNIGIESAGGSPQQLAATINSEMERIGKVIKDANIKAE